MRLTGKGNRGLNLETGATPIVMKSGVEVRIQCQGKVVNTRVSPCEWKKRRGTER